MYLKTVFPDEATGEIAEIYAADREKFGFVMEATSCWTVRSEVLAAQEQFLAVLRGGFSLGDRYWRLITLIAAKQVPSSYCSLVYSKAMIDEWGGKAKVLAIQRDFRSAGLNEKEVAMLTYAEQIATNASTVNAGTIANLRKLGFTDVEIADIALCASWRSFVSRYFDAVGASAEPSFLDPDLEFRSAMSVGKPVENP